MTHLVRKKLCTFGHVREVDDEIGQVAEENITMGTLLPPIAVVILVFHQIHLKIQIDEIFDTSWSWSGFSLNLRSSGFTHLRYTVNQLGHTTYQKLLHWRR